MIGSRVEQARVDLSKNDQGLNTVNHEDHLKEVIIGESLKHTQSYLLKSTVPQK